jgi:peptidyl-prolyl cis-trans isomerase C
MAGQRSEADRILFAVTDGVPLAALREKAEEVLRTVLLDPGAFGTLAARFSNCPAAGVGGNPGQLSRGDVVPEFWKPIDDFGAPGVMPRLIETRFGLQDRGSFVPHQDSAAPARAQLNPVTGKAAP